MPDQFRNVFGTLSQGWHVDRKYLHPIIKIFTKCALFYHRGQVPMRCRDQPDVNLMRAVATEPLEFLLLQNAEEFRL